jgi:hypothetical protein
MSSKRHRSARSGERHLPSKVEFFPHVVVRRDESSSLMRACAFVGQHLQACFPIGHASSSPAVFVSLPTPCSWRRMSLHHKQPVTIADRSIGVDPSAFGIRTDALRHMSGNPFVPVSVASSNLSISTPTISEPAWSLRNLSRIKLISSPSLFDVPVITTSASLFIVTLIWEGPKLTLSTGMERS